MRKCRPTIKRVTGLLLLVISATSCQENTLYHSYQPVEETGWKRNDTLFFSMPQKLANQPYRYKIGLRHKDSYPYRDLWLKVNQDTIHLYLTDTEGYWKGQGFGEMRQLDSTVELTPSPQDSIQDFHIHHIMQDDPLSGIHDIGIQVLKP